MSTKYYNIYDREGKVYRDPFPAPSDADACRMVTASMLTPKGEILKNSPLFMFAAQFDLVCVGIWNPDVGAIAAPDYEFNRDHSVDENGITPRNMPVANVIALVPKEERK